MVFLPARISTGCDGAACQLCIRCPCEVDITPVESREGKLTIACNIFLNFVIFEGKGVVATTGQAKLCPASDDHSSVLKRTWQRAMRRRARPSSLLPVIFCFGPGVSLPPPPRTVKSFHF